LVLNLVGGCMTSYQKDPSPDRVNIELPNGEIISVAKAPQLFIEEQTHGTQPPKAKIMWENNGMSAKHRKRLEKRHRKYINATKKSNKNRER
jgi:hypothetical protein